MFDPSRIKAAVRDGSVDRLFEGRHVLLGVVSPQAQQVATRSQGADRGLRHPTGAGRSSHVQRVADENSAEAQVLAQQSGQRDLAHGRRILGVQLRQHDVGGHDHARARLDRCDERQQLTLSQLVEGPVDHGERDMRVLGGVAVTGKVLGGRSDSRRLQAGDPGGAVRRHLLGRRAKTAHADHRVVRIGIDVDGGGERHVASDPAQLPTDLGSHRPGDVQVVDPAEHRVARIRRAGAGEQPGDVTPFLVDRHDGPRVRGVDRVGQGAQLSQRRDVAGEQADATETGTQPGGQPRGERRSRKPRQQGGQDHTLEPSSRPARPDHRTPRCRPRRHILL